MASTPSVGVRRHVRAGNPRLATALPTITGVKTQGDEDGTVNTDGGVLEVTGTNLDTASDGMKCGIMCGYGGFG